MLHATLDAITILEKTLSVMYSDDTPAVIRGIVYRCKRRLETDAQRLLTGE